MSYKQLFSKLQGFIYDLHREVPSQDSRWLIETFETKSIIWFYACQISDLMKRSAKLI